MNKNFIKIALLAIICLAVYSMLPNYKRHGDIAFADSKGLNLTGEETSSSTLPDNVVADMPSGTLRENSHQTENTVQVVLSAQQEVVISGTMDGVLTELPFDSGDIFKKGQTLAQYNCNLEDARVNEIKARLRVSDREVEAFTRLRQLDAVSDVDFIKAQEKQQQERALLKQARARQDLCTIAAPFDGRVKEATASNYEAVKSGRVLMEVASNDSLQAEMLVPSVWLRWLNIGTRLRVYIHESGQFYNAQIARIHGQVDPVTQTIQITAEIDGYKEELLPGMSGYAEFIAGSQRENPGFLGLMTGESNGQRRN
ncbi:MAG: efflux RND transporter periplasmic adaptor subunit [Pseudomonadota bacterium]